MKGITGYIERKVRCVIGLGTQEHTGNTGEEKKTREKVKIRVKTTK